jgi:hypothetical protein
LLGQNGSLLTYNGFCEKYFTPMITTYAGLKNAVLDAYPWLRDLRYVVTYPHCPKYLYSIICNKRSGTKIYDILVKSKIKHEKYKEKWATELDLQDDDTWWKTINCVVKSLREVKLDGFTIESFIVLSVPIPFYSKLE